VTRLLAAPVLRPFLDEHVFDFYAGRLDPRLSLHRVLARVEAIRPEARGVLSFVLRPNRNWQGFRAGQHVQLSVEIDGVRHTRVYSPSNAPAADGTVTLTVKHHDGGRVSGHLHGHLAVGDVVELSQAFGDFVLADPVPPKLLMIAGGSGITPLMAMLRDLLARRADTDIVFAHYAPTPRDLIFADELVHLGAQHPNVHPHFVATRMPAGPDSLAGRFSGTHLDRIAPDAAGRHTLVCGPAGLLETVNALWRDRGYPDPPRGEAFTPQAVLAADTTATNVVVRCVRSVRDIRGTSSVPLLVQVETAGVTARSGCRMGICHSCTCRKRSGAVKNLLTGMITTEPDEDVRLCISVPVSDVALDL
jgi:ferredoxin-NADP reductase